MTHPLMQLLGKLEDFMQQASGEVKPPHLFLIDGGWYIIAESPDAAIAALKENRIAAIRAMKAESEEDEKKRDQVAQQFSDYYVPRSIKLITSTILTQDGLATEHCEVVLPCPAPCENDDSEG